MGTFNGARVGLESLYYALLTTDASGGTVYETPVAVTGAIEANIVPGSSLETLFADNGPLAVASSLGAIELTLGVADIPLYIQGIILGHSAVADGILWRKSSATPPWLAIGFKALKSTGTYRYVWLLKGKFREPDLNHATKADTVAFQTASIIGNFVAIDYDKSWIKQADEDEDTYVDVGDTWFTDGPDKAP